MYLTILIPCLNEGRTISFCINKAKRFISRRNIDAEILVVDNGSVDDTKEVASFLGARVVEESNKGYGSALRRGIIEAKGDYIIMADGDGSYDFENLEPFVDNFEKGYDFVCGNRFSGYIEKGAMPFSHKIGAPFLSFCARIKHRVPVHDFHCGLRGFKTAIAKSMEFNSTGMEFATELIFKFKDYSMTEVPIVLYKAKREGKPHLRTIRDGFRHLRYIFKN